MNKKIIKYLKNSIDEKGNYCYSLPVETTKSVIKELNRLNNIINRIDNFVDRTIEVIKHQPSGNDEWILERLNGIKHLIELKENK